jgi:microcystin-dependent protein
MAHTRAWDETKPANTDLASSLGVQGRNVKVDVRERMALQHVWNVDATKDGMHKNILFDTASVAANMTMLEMQGYSLSGDNAQHGFYINGTWNTTGLPHLISGNIQVSAANPSSRLISLARDGVEKFGVDINGNTVLTGNLNVTGSIAAGSSPLTRTGEIVMTAAHQPANTLYCDGAAVSRATYAGLFSIIGGVYGAGDGSTTFNVPDMRGRMPIAHGAGAGLTQRFVTQQGGVEAVAISEGQMPSHSHGVNQGNHQHAYETLQPGGIGSDFPPSGQGTAGAYRTLLTDERPSNVSLNPAGGSQAHDNMPPFLVVYFWIYT